MCVERRAPRAARTQARIAEMRKSGGWYRRTPRHVRLYVHSKIIRKRRGEGTAARKSCRGKVSLYGSTYLCFFLRLFIWSFRLRDSVVSAVSLYILKEIHFELYIKIDGYYMLTILQADKNLQNTITIFHNNKYRWLFKSVQFLAHINSQGWVNSSFAKDYYDIAYINREKSF